MLSARTKTDQYLEGNSLAVLRPYAGFLKRADLHRLW